MDHNRNNGGNNNNGNENTWSWWQLGAAAVGVGAAATALYKISSSTNSQSSTSEESLTRRTDFAQTREESSLISRFNAVLEEVMGNTGSIENIVHESSVPAWPHITNVNSLLSDIFNRYVSIKKEEFEKHYSVFCAVFYELHKTMKRVDSYYGRFASDIKFAGSHFDGLRIKKPDEFDMDIVINIPVNMHPSSNPGEDDLTIRQNYPGYVELVAGVQYQKLLDRDGPDGQIYRTAYKWMDEQKFILRSKFVSWFKSVGNRALNEFPKVQSRPAWTVDGRSYTIRTSESGPAWTIIIEGSSFRLDVDLVPAIKFPETRWPVGKLYRSIPEDCKRGYFMVVPKPNKGGNTVQDENRSWRIALQDQEKRLFYNTHALRTTICLIKKFRDAQDMKKIASYYIKTIFFWEIIKLKSTDAMFWQRNDIETLFKYMMKKFYDALDKGDIPYFWNQRLNLIANVDRSILNGYKLKILRVLEALELSERSQKINLVAGYLLTDEEYARYKKFL